MQAATLSSETEGSTWFDVSSEDECSADYAASEYSGRDAASAGRGSVCTLLMLRPGC